jgi:hypothetical protein
MGAFCLSAWRFLWWQGQRLSDENARVRRDFPGVGSLFRRASSDSGGETLEPYLPLNLIFETFSRMKEAWRRRGPGLVLGVALAAGGLTAWMLPNRPSGIPPEKQLVQRFSISGAGGGVEEVEEPFFPERIAEIVRVDPSASTVEDRASVWAYIRETCRVGVSSGGVDWFGIDEALTWLRGASVAPKEIESGLMHLGENPLLLEMLRCLALQHLGAWAEEHQTGAAVAEDLRAIAGDPQSGAVGCAAFKILHRIRSGPEDSLWLRDTAMQWMQREDCAPERRLAAIEAAVDLHVSEAEPNARKLIAPSRLVAERVGGFLALGELGNGTTRQWILDQPVPTEVLVAEARKIALTKLAKR